MSEQNGSANRIEEGQQIIQVEAPGSDNDAVRRRKPSTNLLPRALPDFIEKRDEISRVGIRILAIEGETKYQLWIESDPTTERSREFAARRLESECDTKPQDSKDNIDPLTYAFARYIAEVLPDVFGIEIVRCDMSPLGDAPPPTHRLLATSQEGLPIHTTPTDSPLVDLLARMDKRGRPYMYRCDLEPVKQRHYRCKLGISRFDQRGRLFTHQHLGRRLTSGWRPDVARTFDLDHLTSPMELLSQVGWQDREVERDWHHGNIYKLTHDSEADANLEFAVELAAHVLRPLSAYNWMRSRETDLTDEEKTLYERLGADPFITISRDELPAILAIIPGTSTPEQWNDPPGRNTPRVETIHRLRPAAGVDYESEADAETGATERGVGR